MARKIKKNYNNLITFGHGEEPEKYDFSHEASLLSDYLGEYEGSFDDDHFIDYATDWYNDNMPKNVREAISAQDAGNATPEQNALADAWDKMWQDTYNEYNDAGMEYENEKSETDPDYAPHTDATSEIYDEGFNKFMDEQHGTDLNSIAKNIIARDLGRSL